MKKLARPAVAGLAAAFLALGVAAAPQASADTSWGYSLKPAGATTQDTSWGYTLKPGSATQDTSWGYSKPGATTQDTSWGY